PMLDEHSGLPEGRISSAEASRKAVTTVPRGTVVTSWVVVALRCVSAGRAGRSVCDVQGLLQACHLGVPWTQGLQMVAVLDQLEDRGRVIGRMIDSGFIELQRDQQRRNAGARAPLVVRRGRGAMIAGRRHVIPSAAEFLIGDDDERVLAVRAVHDRLDQVDKVVVAAALAGVAGMLVLLADGLDEADGLE